MAFKPVVGELRPSQMMYAYGVGAVVDLPYLSVMVMGLDEWPADPGVAPPISEERLLRAVKWTLGDQVQVLLHPPATPETPGLSNPFSEEQRIGVPVAPFPRWMVCPECRILAPLSSGLFTLKKDLYHPERTQYVHTACPKAKRPPVVFPARFMISCENGHLDEFPWRLFVHGGPTDCAGTLRLIEFGPSGEARDVVVRCDGCGKRRALSLAFGKSGEATMPMCRGRRPHLGDYEECTLQAKAILLGASNLWFPEVLTTLAIPSGSSHLARLVEEQWAQLQHVNGLDAVTMLRHMGHLGAFAGYSDEAVWRAIQEHRESGAGGDEPADLKSPEWAVFSQPGAAPSSGDFRLRQVPVPEGFEGVFDKVVLGERLREVRALVGFTRVDAPGELSEAPLADLGRRMALCKGDPLWVPATEVRGEGIFIQFREDALRAWAARPAVMRRADEFLQSHIRWRKARHLEPPEGEFPGARYLLLHSVAHALMRQLCLECGYTAASLRERTYSREAHAADGRDEAMAGILIYTAAPDSEGTLGGLVSLGEPEELGRHLRAALESAALCASDPLCAERDPSQQGVTLHAAACHACLFAPETSCERGNRYLDRSVLAPTVERSDLAFFPVPH
jgi:hypothetical protein